MNPRQISVFNYLLAQNDYVTAKIISKEFNVTPKTIYIDINILQEELVEYGLSIDKKTNCGILLIGSDESKVMARSIINSCDESFTNQGLDVESRRIQLFVDLVLFGNSISLQKTSEQYYVSKSSILNDLEFLRKRFLRKYHVNIETDFDKKIRLTGTEENIQLAIINAFINTILKKEKEQTYSIFNEKINSVINNMLENSEIIDLNGFADYYRQALKITLFIFVTRIENGFHIKKDEYYFLDDLDFMKNYPIAKDISDYLEEQLNMKCTNEDKMILAKYLASYRIKSINPNESDYKEVVNRIINCLEEIENICIKNREELTNQLLLHIPSMVLRLKNGIKIENPLLDEVKSRYLHLFTLSWYVLSTIESEYDINLTEDEISFIVIYFQMAINKSSNSHRILVVCPYGIVSSKYVVSQLKNVLPKYDDIQACGYEDLKNKQLDNLDLIVSTSSQKIDTLIPVVHVSPMLDNVDCAKIFDAYSKYVFLKSTRIREIFNKNNINIPLLSQHINKDNIFFKLDFQTKEECLDFMIKKLEKTDVVKKGFRKSVYKRESIGSTVLENGVAIPHGIPTEVNEIGLVILTLKRPIKWSNNWVDMIVLMAVPEDKTIEFESMILELYEMISNTDIIEEIKKIKSIDECSFEK
ncbi:PTS sugar transporter subunit IIA [[Clostridium] innocuum]|uniref:BglG family transcription antiterminator n=1 Tax=Clostridium innocuum TaxID=1522 RepID=UPI001EDDC946|nr:PTS sugar transporter subunit IIA [[Clostridium] innocuum]MCG4660742.1 PTS sugar transporter subunit IIA [[Clostridium] innocuum]